MKNLRHYLAWTLLSTMFLGGCLNTQVPTGTPPQVIVPSTDSQQEELMESDEILEQTYTTQLIEHAYIEPESVIAIPILLEP